MKCPYCKVACYGRDDEILHLENCEIYKKEKELMEDSKRSEQESKGDL